MKKLFLCLIVLILTTSFHQTQSKAFVDTKNLSEFKHTIFTPTLEDTIPQNKNIIYASTLLLAWDQIKKYFNSDLMIPVQFPELRRLNQSTSHINTLDTTEYKASIEVNGDQIIAKAQFNKSLPFSTHLQSSTEPLIIDHQKIAFFGIFNQATQEQKQITQILYYKNDSNFIIKLQPIDTNHEIILFKNDQNFKSISEMIVEIEKLSKIGLSEKEHSKSIWKYTINENDEIFIPKFNFNIETNHKNIEGSSFHASDLDFQIDTAWQRTAFILNETGTQAQSESKIIVSVSAIMTEEPPQPKTMILNKNFLIVLKRTQSKYPYFAMWTNNTELMLKH